MTLNHRKCISLHMSSFMNQSFLLFLHLYLLLPTLLVLTTPPLTFGCQLFYPLLLLLLYLRSLLSFPHLLPLLFLSLGLIQLTMSLLILFLMLYFLPHLLLCLLLVLVHRNLPLLSRLILFFNPVLLLTLIFIQCLLDPNMAYSSTCSRVAL